MSDSKSKHEEENFNNKSYSYNRDPKGIEYHLENNHFNDFVDDYLQKIGDLLKRKNKSYGNSAIDPIRVFSKADRLEQINVRIDDKLSRIMQGNNSFNEDTEDDLIGYLILKKYCNEN